MKMASKKKVALFTSVLTSSLVLVDPIAWSSRTAAPFPPKDAISAGETLKPIAPAEISRTVIATGTLNASVNVEVGSQLSGLIANLAVDFNDVVQKGQLLAQLDDSKYRAEVDAAKAAMETAKADERIVAARLERALTEIRQTEMQRQILEVRVEKATIALDTATREMNRKSALSDRNFAPAADAQDSSARRDTARAVLREAQVELENHANAGEAARSEVTRTKAELEKTHAIVKQLEAQLQATAIDLERTSIRSPIDGVIVGRNVTEGQTLATALEARTLFVVAADLRQLDIWARVDESDIAKIAVGQKATFTVDSFPGREFTAKVTQIRKAPQVVQNVVTYTVVLAARNDDYSLLPGMTVVARIETQPVAASEKISSALPAQNEVGVR
jgi:HlyD family secretion protein